MPGEGIRHTQLCRDNSNVSINRIMRIRKIGLFIVASAVLAVPATADAAFWNKWFKKGKADTTEVAEQDPEKVQEIWQNHV